MVEAIEEAETSFEPAVSLNGEQNVDGKKFVNNIKFVSFVNTQLILGIIILSTLLF